MKTTLRTVLKNLLPFLIMGLAYYLFTKTGGMSKPQLEFIRVAPYAVFAVGAIISWKFNRSRDFFITIILAFCLAAMDHMPKLIDRPVRDTDMYAMVCFIIPANIALFSFFRERGIVSLWGGIRMAVVAGQALFAFWIMDSGQQELIRLLQNPIAPVDLQSVTPIPQGPLILFAAALVILILKQISSRSSQDISHIGVLCGMFVALHMHADAGLPETVLGPILFAASGIVLVTSIIQDSYSMAFTDELTGLPSRRALKQDMLKLGINYAMAMLDVDHFKKFNDTYGHDTGDEVLKLVASEMRGVTGGGKPYRYGGEEFTILFPGKSIAEVLPHLEELRERISKRAFTLRRPGRKKGQSNKRGARSRGSKSGKSKQIYITVSIGVSQKSEKNKTPDTVMKSADTALYRAKKKGRNCVSK